eukprot:8544116-Pyramimonas_sp.AAC.1
MDRASKLRKISDARHALPHVSKTALSAFCAAARRGDLPEIASTKDIRDARDASADILTPYGHAMHTVQIHPREGGPIDVEIVDPIPYIYALANRCPRFVEVLKAGLRKHPCDISRPWSVVLYSDEAKPGNRLKQHNRRALQLVYFSFFELGPPALSKEDFWLCVGAVKSDDISSCNGGMAQLVGCILRRMFNPEAHDLMLSGMTLDFPDGSSTRFVAKLVSVLGDESGLHQTWLCKGSGGTKCCCQCLNIVN